MKLNYRYETIVRPTEIHVIDDSGNKYQIEDFCGPIQYYYWDTDDEQLCTDYFGVTNRYEYDYLEIATDTAYLKILYITFCDDVLSYPNDTMPGLVSPAKIDLFGFTTSNLKSIGTSSIDIELYWDIDVYICHIVVDEATTTTPNIPFHCVVNDPAQVTIYQHERNYTVDVNLFILYFNIDEILKLISMKYITTMRANTRIISTVSV